MRETFFRSVSVTLPLGGAVQKLVLAVLVVGIVWFFVPSSSALADPDPPATDDPATDDPPARRARGANRLAAEESWPRVCRILSFSDRQIRRWAFEKLRAAGPACVPAVVEAMPTATTNGKQLLLLLVAMFPSTESATAALQVLLDPTVSLSVIEAARSAVAAQSAADLRELLPPHLTPENPFAWQRIGDALALVPVGVALPILLDAHPAPLPANPTPSPAVALSDRLIRLVWQTSALRAALNQPMLAQSILERMPADRETVVVSMVAALGAYRRALPELRAIRDRSHRVRQRGERALLGLFRAHPVLVPAMVADRDFRVRNLALMALKQLEPTAVVLVALRALTDPEGATGPLAVTRIIDAGPLSPADLAVLSRFCPDDCQTRLADLARRLPDMERLEFLRAERDRLQHELAPMIYQRTLHDMVAGQRFREWFAVQNEWTRIGTVWRAWWTEHAATLASPPPDSLYSALRLVPR